MKPATTLDGSDTPRTDACITTTARLGDDKSPYYVPIDFARQLERELAKARAEGMREAAAIVNKHITRSRSERNVALAVAEEAILEAINGD